MPHLRPSTARRDGIGILIRAMPSLTDSIGRVLGDRYRLVTPVGTGASAHVYLADDVSLKRQVAIKVLHPALAGDQAFLKRFRAEARAVAALNHPNVLRVYDWGEQDGEPYLVLEYLAGGSLRQIYDTGVLLTPAQAVRIGIEACAGLDYAHRRGLIHRDIKPANLLFDADGRLRIADFGLARALAEAAWTEPDGAMLGTARYAAPEQVEGWVLDGKADVYALALVLYEGVTGESPFIGDTTVATMMARIGALLPEHEALGPWVRCSRGRPPPTGRALRRGAFGAELTALAADPSRAGTAPARDRRARGGGPLPPGRRRRADPAERAAGRPAAPGPGRWATSPNSGMPPAPAAAPATERPPPPFPWPRPSPDGSRGRRPPPLAVAGRDVRAGGRAGRRRRRLGRAGQGLHPLDAGARLVGRTLPAARSTAADAPRVRVAGPDVVADRARRVGRRASTPDRGPGATAVMVKQGSTISVVVSTGPPLVAIPDLTSFTNCHDAVAALAAVHLVGVCPAAAAQYSSTVVAGAVIGTSPSGRAPYGSTVTIVTSKGHAPVAVPAVVGRGSTYASAAAALTAAGFVPPESKVYRRRSRRPGRSPPPRPPAGRRPTAPRSPSQVSLGPQPVTVPP